jgi:hypothetical protein
MSKARRGKGIKELFDHGRGNCPICKRSAVKLLYEHEIDGKKIKICKICRAKIKHKKESINIV